MFIIQVEKAWERGQRLRGSLVQRLRLVLRMTSTHRKRRALFATPSSSLEDLESAKGKKFCKMTTSSSSFEDNLPLSQSGK